MTVFSELIGFFDIFVTQVEGACFDFRPGLDNP